jgi:hypothetical protein
MRKYLQIAFLSTFLILCSPTVQVFAQEPPHPPLTGHGEKGNSSPAGSARIGDGISILAAFGLAYGYRKLKRRGIGRKVVAKQE